MMIGLITKIRHQIPKSKQKLYHHNVQLELLAKGAYFAINNYYKHETLVNQQYSNTDKKVKKWDVLICKVKTEYYQIMLKYLL